MAQINYGGIVEMNHIQILATFLAGSMWQKRTGEMTCGDGVGNGARLTDFNTGVRSMPNADINADTSAAGGYKKARQQINRWDGGDRASGRESSHDAGNQNAWEPSSSNL